MGKDRHSKYKNTGILFELLVRQITNDMMLGNQNSPAVSLVKEFFKKGSSLNRELQLYQTLQKTKFGRQDKANTLIDTVISEYKKINKRILSKQKYNLIKEIKNNYILENFFKTKVPSYKINASIWRLLEAEGINPTKTVQSRYYIIENIINKKVNKEKIDEVSNELNKHDKDLRLLSYKILLEKFNSKYGTKLQASQKNLLRAYIENISNSDSIKKFVVKEINKLTNVIDIITPKVSNKVIRIKLSEVSNQLRKIKDTKVINETHILSCMRSYSLIKELKNVIK
jgi:transposase